eukprot:55458_1
MEDRMGTWFVHFMDSEGYYGYFPKCLTKSAKQVEGLADNEYLLLVSEFQHGVLSGFEGTVKCEGEHCTFHYFGIQMGDDTKLVNVGIKDTLVVYTCTDSMFTGWRQ